MITAPDSGRPSISVVVPARNESENLPRLLGEIGEALESRSFEIIVVDDGSDDDTENTLRSYAYSHGYLRVIHHHNSCGQSCSVRSGLLHARGEFIVTIDGDGQNDPAYIPALIGALEGAAPAVALAAGQRVGRQASLYKRYASKAANAIRGALLKDRTRDSGCGLKVIRRDVFLKLPYFDSWHRFIPALVLREGYEITHVDVVDRQRQFGRSNYGIFDRALIGALDLFGVWWLRRRREKIPKLDELELRPQKELELS
ncbi:glycosyltransferase family 2 protein [Flexibacterium corallicola]|uniref:glycosyltransferase family 2 protein n=1 Tax=Flexibacterium corallicola TaxID=3037259 RepID=UPI00286F373A|nr:glycosyltransferase family 2 protein [Pseudovibrio sp. M1P-2-3]